MILGGGFIVLVVLAWEICAQYGLLDRRFSSQPSAILAATIEIAESGELWANAHITLSEFALGYGLSIAIGLAIGFVAGWSLYVGRIIDPFLMAFGATPRSALIPLLIIWFGLGFSSKVVLVFLSAIIPIVINTITGVRTTDPRLMQVAESFGASLPARGLYIILPGSLPHIFSGLRLGLNLALIGVIIAEMYVSTAGIGRMIVLYGSVLRIDELFAYIIIVSLFGCALVALLSVIERVVVPWR